MLLKRLRDTMARADSVENTLGEVVRLVANEMVAEVCSIYLLRAGEVLELFATQGLNPSAVHRTRLACLRLRRGFRARASCTFADSPPARYGLARYGEAEISTERAGRA